MAWMMEHLKVDQQATFIRVIRSCYVELRKEQSLGENPDYSDWDKLRAALPEEEKEPDDSKKKDFILKRKEKQLERERQRAARSGDGCSQVAEVQGV